MTCSQLVYLVCQGGSGSPYAHMAGAQHHHSDGLPLSSHRRLFGHFQRSGLFRIYR